jgi:beta-lactamase regulating signal transducer with metallopeptidase domain
MIAWLGIGAMASARLRRQGCSRIAPDRLGTALDRIVGAGRQPPRLIISPGVAQPMALGLINPAIVLPPSFAETEPQCRIEAALAHEWTHIRNGDLWLLAVSRLLLPLFFAHPLYAWLRRRIRMDQELLADAAGARDIGPIAYSEALVTWARAPERRIFDPFARSLGLGAWSSSLTRRVALLLDRDFRVEPACPPSFNRCAHAIVVAVTIALVLIKGTPGWPFVPIRPAQSRPRLRQPVQHILTSYLCPQQTASLETADYRSLRCAD